MRRFERLWCFKIQGLAVQTSEDESTPTLRNVEKYSNTSFFVPADAHYYKIIEMLKQFKKIITFAPTCFGSRRNHPQGAVLCLAKITIMVFLCSSV